jgi:hypothetical protein
MTGHRPHRGLARAGPTQRNSAAEGERIRKAFVKAVRPYSKAKGIGYGAWRKVGVPADVLREAGITRGQ